MLIYYPYQKLLTLPARFVRRNHIHNIRLCVKRRELKWSCLCVIWKKVCHFLTLLQLLDDIYITSPYKYYVRWYFNIFNTFDFIHWNHRRHYLSTSIFHNKIKSLIYFISHNEKLQKAPYLQKIYTGIQRKDQRLHRVIVVMMSIFLEFR